MIRTPLFLYTVAPFDDFSYVVCLSVQNLHGMPGLLGGFIAGIAAFGQAAGVAPHGSAQIGFQILSLLCTMAIASTGGALGAAFATGGWRLWETACWAERFGRKARVASDDWLDSLGFGLWMVAVASAGGAWALGVRLCYRCGVDTGLEGVFRRGAFRPHCRTVGRAGGCVVCLPWGLQRYGITQHV
jgi:hypothetical protein